ncbi:PREDICTED: uncharacterized protein LOC109148764 isoform X2 [Ipomoea nil]|uniref:uncharacterized protein LOC109148764 isoform X2 n=1 Tax=Ipomoea nil TaxID=35883 RepID=UPI000900ACCE|nr:PREDICTED: uncharacterized protein LOC109148764 isoform X2 [Ipomoea nil]
MVKAMEAPSQPNLEAASNYPGSQPIPATAPEIPVYLPENPAHEGEGGHNVVPSLHMSFFSEDDEHEVGDEVEEGHEVVNNQELPTQQPPPPTAKKQKTLGLRKQVKTKQARTRKCKTRSTMGFKSKFKGNFNEPIEIE